MDLRAMAPNPKILTLEPWLQNPFDKQIFTWMVVVVCLVLALDILAGKGSIPLTIRVNYERKANMVPDSIHKICNFSD